MTQTDVLAMFARERVAALVEQRAADALAAIRVLFQAARARRKLPPFVVDSDKVLKLPKRFTCPECGGPTLVEIHEWGTKHGIATSGGYTISCQAEDEELMDAIAEDREPEWEHNHWQDPGWMGLYSQVGRWLARNVRVRVDPEEARRAH
jgi:hypothetical protein